jgi:hypothetical protein
MHKTPTATATQGAGRRLVQVSWRERSAGVRRWRVWVARRKKRQEPADITRQAPLILARKSIL